MESNAKNGAGTRRVSALQDLASILELTGIDSDVLLPVNADTEGQVVLPVSDGQIDLVLKMVLPDFLHEILQRLDTILAKDTPTSTGRKSNFSPDDMTELIEIKKSIDQIKDSTGSIDNLPQETLDRVHLLETLHTDPIDNPPENFTDTPPPAMVRIKPKRPPPPRRQSTLESSPSKNSSFQETESGDGYEPMWEPLTVHSPSNKEGYNFLDSDSMLVNPNSEPIDTKFQPYFLHEDKSLEVDFTMPEPDRNPATEKPARPPLPFEVSSFQTKEKPALSPTESADSLEVDIDELMQQSSPFWKPNESINMTDIENKSETNVSDVMTQDSAILNKPLDTPNDEMYGGYNETSDAKRWFDRRLGSSYKDPFDSTDPFSTFEDRDSCNSDSYPHHEAILEDGRQDSKDSHHLLYDEHQLPATERSLGTLPLHAKTIISPQIADIDPQLREEAEPEKESEYGWVHKQEKLSPDTELPDSDTITNMNPNDQEIVGMDQGIETENSISFSVVMPPSENDPKEMKGSLQKGVHESDILINQYEWQSPKSEDNKKYIVTPKSYFAARDDSSYCSSDSLHTIEEDEILIVSKPLKYQPVLLETERNLELHADMKTNSEENFSLAGETPPMYQALQLIMDQHLQEQVRPEDSVHKDDIHYCSSDSVRTIEEDEILVVSKPQKPQPELLKSTENMKTDAEEHFPLEDGAPPMDPASQLKLEKQQHQEQQSTEDESMPLLSDKSFLQCTGMQSESPSHHDPATTETSKDIQQKYEIRVPVKQCQSSQSSDTENILQATLADGTNTLHSNETATPVRPPRSPKMKRLNKAQTSSQPSQSSTPQSQPIHMPDKHGESSHRPSRPPRPSIPTKPPRQRPDEAIQQDSSAKIPPRPMRPPPPTPPLTPQASPKPVRPPRPKSMTSLLGEDAEIFDRDEIGEKPRRPPPLRPALSKSHSDLSSVNVEMSHTSPPSPKPRRPPPPKQKDIPKSNDKLARITAPGKIPKLEIPDNINNLESDPIEDLSESEQAKSPKSPNLTRQSHVSIPEEPLPEVGYMMIDPTALDVISIRKVDKSEIDDQDFELIGTGKTPDASEFHIEDILSPADDIKINSIGNLIDLSPLKEGDRRIVGKFHSVEAYDTSESHLASSLQQVGWLNLEQTPQTQVNPNIIITKPGEANSTEEMSDITNLATNLADGIVKSSVEETLNNIDEGTAKDIARNSTQEDFLEYREQENDIPYKKADEIPHSSDGEEVRDFTESTPDEKEYDIKEPKETGNPEMHQVDQPTNCKYRPMRPSSLPGTLKPDTFRKEASERRIGESREPKHECNETISALSQKDTCSTHDDLPEINAADVTSGPKNKARSISSKFSWHHRGMTIAVNTSFLDSSERIRPDRDGSFDVQVDLPTVTSLSSSPGNDSIQP